MASYFSRTRARTGAISASCRRSRQPQQRLPLRQQTKLDLEFEKAAPRMRGRLFICDSSGAGFSLWGFVLARTKPHRLKPAPPKCTECKSISHYRILKDGSDPWCSLTKPKST